MELDDIDLLNIYRYPENYPRELVSGVQSSKELQKRLESLLRAAGPAPRNSQRQGGSAPTPSETAAQLSAGGEGQRKRPVQGQPKPGKGKFAKLLKKLIP